MTFGRSGPSDSGAAWCGHRSRSARKLPSRFRTTTTPTRPTWTARTPPGSSSSALNTPTAVPEARVSTRVSVNAGIRVDGVLAEDLAGDVLGQTGRERLARHVAVVVRIVAREEDPLVAAHPVHQVHEVLRREVLHRLGGEADLLAHVLARLALHPGNLGPEHLV